MAHSISVQPKGAYLHVIVRGDNTFEDVSQYIKETSEACQQHHCFNILIEEHLSGPTIGALHMYEIINQNLNLLLPFDHHLAYVDINPEHDKGNNQFVETVAVNRGLHVKLFFNTPEAEEWLLKQSQSKA